MLNKDRSFTKRIFYSDKQLLEVQNSILSIVVGLVFLANAILGLDIYDRYPDTYQYMKWCPIWIWGIVYFSAGIIHILSVVLNYRYVRKQILIIKGCLWMYLGMCVVYADPALPNGYLYFIFCLFALISFLKIKIVNEDNV